MTNFKIIVLCLTLGMFVFSGSACAAVTDNEEVTTNGDMVYLKVENAAASSFDESPDWAPKPDPMAPVDADLNTRWSSGYKDGEWIYFDFGKPKTVSKIVIKWEQAYASSYEILSSDDAKTWKRVVLLEGQTGGTNEMKFQPVTARYVKILGLKRANPEWGISIWEVEAYGPKDKNPEDLPLEDTFKKSAQKSEFEKKLDEIRLIAEQIVPSPGPIAVTEFQKGVNYTSWDKSELATDLSDYSLIYLSKLGVKHVALMSVYYQDDAESKRMYADVKKTTSDESLGHAINIIHALGMKVMLKPHVDLVDEDARSNIIPSDEWFKNYKEFIIHYAQLAAKYNVELLCIGTELSNTTTSRWKEKWLDIISDIKKVYKGSLTYAANWDEYETVSFWNDMDSIGIDAYFPLTNEDNPPLEELVKAWTKHADTLEKWLKENGLNKPVIFTEIGYDTIIGSNKQPWRILPTLATYVESQEEQSNCLESLMKVLTKRSWFKGLYWWNYFPRPDIGPLGYTLRGKRGEKVLSDWYEKTK
ncbi:MAG: discoidin domain-containing protein [Candidatus Omnitrophica bacterium]|nr:discoidin domain-containing protein [Candidatus Omnitrophota bacterium]